jgi:hypothetical protein
LEALKGLIQIECFENDCHFNAHAVQIKIWWIGAEKINSQYYLIFNPQYGQGEK